jgi:hypothetical protein
VVLIIDVPFFKLYHNLLVDLEGHLFFRLLSMNLVGEFHESMKVVCLLRSHPVTTIDEGSLDHLELLSSY